MVSFVILHYIVKEETISCVSRILKLDGDCHVVIVDNHSPNHSGEELKEYYQREERVSVILNPENAGFARGNNLGCDFARKNDDPDFYVVMNNDAEVAQHDFISRLYRIYDAEKFDVLGPDIYSTTAHVHQSPKSLKRTTIQESRRLQDAYRRKLDSRVLTPLKCFLKQNRLIRFAAAKKKAGQNHIDYHKKYRDVPLHGACLIFSRSFAEKRESFFFPDTWFYYESEVLDYECRLQSLKVVYDPSIRVLHHQNAATNVAYRSELKKTRFMNEQNYRSITAFLNHYGCGQLRIAMFGHKHIPSREGGVEIVTEELATRMAAQGHNVTVYNRGKGQLSDCEGLDSGSGMYKGVRIVPVWTLEKKGLAALTGSLSAAWKVITSSCDVVHIHAEGPAAVTGILKLFRKHVVVTIHGLDWKREKWKGFAKRYIRFGEETAVRHADAIIVLSESVREYFRNQYGRETVFIPNGISRPVLRDAEEITQRWGLQKDSYVLFLGRLVPEKGLRCLIRAWEQVKTGKTLVIAGGSSDTDDFVKELKAAAGKNVIFTGFQQGRILEELYSNAYLYVLPSDLEGMPISLLEAMSFGCCVLTSDIRECTEVTGDHGVTFKQGDAADLACRLQELLEDENRVLQYKANAADYICSRYSWEETVRKTLEVYRG